MGEDGARSTPFDAVFRAAAAERFRGIRDALHAAAVDPFDRDGFLMARPVVELVHELRPGEGIGEAMDEFVALVHHGYLFWHAGESVVRLGRKGCERLVAGAGPRTEARPARSDAYYVQYPARRIWGEPQPGQSYQPLDGCFVVGRAETLSATAIFGFHPGRAALTVVEVAGRRPLAPAREDGSGLFAPVLTGGAAAGLHSVTTMEELLELVWRSDDLVRDRLQPGVVAEMD